MKRRSILGSCLAATVLTGLLAPVGGHAQQAEVEKPAAEPQAEDLFVRVENLNWLDMHVYISQSGGPLRSLGMVTSMSSQGFHVPTNLGRANQDVRVIADPIGGSGIYVSPSMMVGPQSEIVVKVQNALELSYSTLEPRDDDS